ncbi:hypothetical protein cypCar_00047012, partial [Cyprinus carpio]
VFDDTVKEKSLSVMEGDSVTLCTDVTKVQRNDQILWMYSINNSDTRIAEIYKQVISIYDNNEIFRDRLQMDYHSGSLTITNIRTEHSGLYKLTVIGGGVIYKSFTVTVHETFPVHEASPGPEFTPVAPEAVASTAESPEEAASTAEPPEVVAPTFKLSACPAVAKEAIHELSACPAMAKEAVPELSACPVTAKEAIHKLSACPAMTMEAVHELSACPVTGQGGHP